MTIIEFHGVIWPHPGGYHPLCEMVPWTQNPVQSKFKNSYDPQHRNNKEQQAPIQQYNCSCLQCIEIHIEKSIIIIAITILIVLAVIVIIIVIVIVVTIVITISFLAVVIFIVITAIA